MSSTSRMRWRPAVGVLVLGGIAIGLTYQGVSAERSRTTTRDRAVKNTPKLVTAAEMTPAGVRPIEVGQTSAVVAVDGKPGTSGASPSAVQPAETPAAAKARQRVTVDVIRAELEGAGELPKTVDVTPEAAPVVDSAPAGGFDAADIAAGTGACCTACPNSTCLNNQTQVACEGSGGTWRGKLTTCDAATSAGCTCRACCEPDGSPLNNTPVDVRADACINPNTFHTFASWQNTANLPAPFCNIYSASNALWDNGLPLINDGGAQRSHIDAENGAVGYSFVTADDIVLRGPNTEKANFNTVEAWFMMRPSEPEIPNPDIDVSAYLITVFADRPALVGTATTGPAEIFPSPAGFMRTPRTREDCCAPIDDVDGDGDVQVIARCDITYPHHRVPGGVLYSRIVPRGGIIPVTHTRYCDVFTCPPNPCNPPDESPNFESDDIWRTQITNLNPPIILNKNDVKDVNPDNNRYWFSIQGAFPFADGLRSTLQTWMMLSVNATGQRAKTFRSQNSAWFGVQACTVNSDCQSGDEGYENTVCISGACRRDLMTACVSNPTCTAIAAGATCIASNCSVISRVPVWLENTGNRADAACVGAPPVGTRRDLAFKLSGVKDPPGVPGDTCPTAVTVFDGVTGYTSVGAADDGVAASCPAATPMPNDLYFRYTATCNGLLTVSAGASGGIVAIYDSFACSGNGAGGMQLDELPPLGVPACSTLGSVTERVTQTGTYLIRVANAAEGKGFLSVTCDDPCYFGSINAAASCCPVAECDDPGDCTVVGEDCSPEGFCARPCLNDTDCLAGEPVCGGIDGYCHAVLFGCKSPGNNEGCCRTICGDDPACCGSFGGVYDFFCISEARGEPSCACACLLDDAVFNVDEAEHPVADPDRCDVATSNTQTTNNGACANDAPNNDPDVRTTTVACGQTFRGTVWADGGQRDIDYWKLNVPDANNDGKARIDLSIESAAPIVVFVLDASVCDQRCNCDPVDGSCPNAGECPTGNLLGTYLCDSDLNGFCGIPVYDAIFAAGCGPVSLSVTVDIPLPDASKNFWILIATFDSNEDSDNDPDNNRELVGKFSGLPCGTQNKYIIDVACDDDGPHPQGGCCACTGGCVDNDLIACIQSNGTWTGGSDDELCGSAPCGAYQHGCSLATNVVLNGSGHATVVATPTDARPPSEGYPCGTGAPNDSVWYTVTVPAGVDSIGVKTCDSAGSGRDSVVAVYCGDCCDTDPADRFKVPAQGCSEDECGFTGFNSRFCTQNLTNADGGVDEFAACRTGGPGSSVQLYVQISNFGEPLEGTYELDLDAPCSGSCCNTATGTCADGISIANCQGANQVHSIGDTCATLDPPCGKGACCQNNGTCTDVIGSNNCVGANFNLGAICDTGSINGFICNPADSCDYDHSPPGNNGLTAQIFTDIDVIFEEADNFIFKGTTTNDCLISRVDVSTFNTNHQSDEGCTMNGGANCADTPFDYEGVVLMIASDIDPPGTGTKGPICAPRLPVDGNPPFHTPLGADCQEFVFGPGSADPLAPGVQGWWWVTTNPGGQAAHQIIMQLHPPVQLEKNKKYWLGWAPIMPLTEKYQVVWSATENLDGNLPQRFASNGSMIWEPFVFDPPRDMYFNIVGSKQIIGCGGCRAYMDFEPFFCVVDVGDLLRVLAAYSEIVQCSTTTSAGITPGSQVWDGGCPLACTVNADCNGAFGPEECVGGLCCDLTELSEVIQVLDVFSDINSPSCPHRCAPGACSYDPPGAAPVCCRDIGYFDPNIQTQGTTQSDCGTLPSSTYAGDNTNCASAFPGQPVCNTP